MTCLILGFEETHANVIEEVRSLVETISFQTFELRDEIRSLRHRLQAICIAVEHSEFQSISHQVRDHVEGQFRMLENFIASLPERLAIRDIPESENETILLRDQLRGFSNVFEGYRGSFEYLTAEITASELKLRNHGVVGL